jgi:hypothetical protein
VSYPSLYKSRLKEEHSKLIRYNKNQNIKKKRMGEKGGVGKDKIE